MFEVRNCKLELVVEILQASSSASALKEFFELRYLRASRQWLEVVEAIPSTGLDVLRPPLSISEAVMASTGLVLGVLQSKCKAFGAKFQVEFGNSGYGT